MTISSTTGFSYATQVSAQRLAALKSQFDGLNEQLSTGKVAQTYGGLGIGRSTALSAQGRISALDGYAQGITAARTKLSLASASVTQVQSIASSVSSSLSAGTSGQTTTGLATQRLNARQQLSAALDALNQTTGQDYLFSGRATDTQPVASADLILDGDKAAGLDGLTTMIAERKAADGAGGTGNLTPAWTTGSDTVTLSEAGDGLTRANFGFILGSVTSSGGAITATPAAGVAAATSATLAQQPKDGDVVRVTINQPDGSQKLVDYVARANPTPGTNEFSLGTDKTTAATNLNKAISDTLALTPKTALAAVQSADPPGAGIAAATTGTAAGNPGSVALKVAGTPADGDRVTVNLTLRDGTTTSLTLTARTNPDAADPTQFAIGATPDATAKSLQGALQKSLTTAAGTTLAGSSATLAARDMFAGSATAGLSPRRIEATGTGYAFSADPAGQTVVWYQGDDGTGDARATASVQVGAGDSVAYGARANEPAFQSALAGLGALASESFGTTGTVSTTDAARNSALSSRVASLLAPTDGSQTLTQVGTELSLADTAMANAQTRNTAAKAVLQNTVSGIEDADTNTVAAQLLSLQTQLQASYQVTSMISKLSLVNYL